MTKQLVIYRPFEWAEVMQEVDTLMYNATNVLKAYNAKTGDKKELDHYLRNNATKEYIELLEQKQNLITPKKEELEKVVSTKRGKFWGTWFNEHLLVDFMMWLSVDYKHAAISFIIDGHALAFGRNKIKEGYKRMCKAIADSGSSNYRDEATMLNVLVSGSPSSNQRARYWEDKIELMDDMQKSNATMIRLWLPLEQRKNALIKEFL